MATDWRKILDEHAILQPLAKYQDRLTSITECKDWLVFRDGEIFLWDRNTGSVLTSNLKHSKLKPDSSRNVAYKTLALSALPVEEVDHMLLSPGGRYLALVSKRELIIVQLPSQYDEQGPHNDRNTVKCKCISVAEHLLKTSAVCLVDVAWHPGSLDDSHIVLLTADNYIRTYDIENPSSPVESHSVGGDEDEKLSTFTVRLRWAQGSSAVGFDFGPPIDLETKSKITQKLINVAKVWPLYVLFGNGDVFKVMSSIEPQGYQKLRVEGPMMVYPAAENAERNEASAILCLGGEPTVLVLASRSGRVDHCIVLDSENNQDTEGSELESFRHLTLEAAPSSSLYIYETVQLELSLTSSLNDDCVEEPFTCMMQLYKDVSQKNRYLCVHNAGLHAVALSWFYKVQEFTQTEMETDLSHLLENSPSVVEHLVCTKPLSCSEGAPLLGVAAINCELQKIFVVLTVTLEFIVLPLRTCINRSPHSRLLSNPDIVSPMKRVLREPFDERIRKLLQRSSSNPIIKATKDTELTGEDCFILLSQTVQMLRREHVLKLEVVRKEIQKRLELHEEMKRSQEKQLNQLKQTEDILREQARLLAEKYEVASENQLTLIHRLEAVLRKLSAKSPVMSAAEENMYKELMQMRDNLEYVNASINELKNKQNYQEKRSTQDKQEKKNAPRVSNQQQRILRNLLKDQGEEIADLVKKVKQLQSSLEL